MYKLPASSAYTHKHLLEAVVKSIIDPVPDLRRRAQAKESTWRGIVNGIISGEFPIGLTTPVAKTPAWVTPEVSNEGFATGAFAAGGEITVAERNLASRFHLNVSHNKLRGGLNSRLLTNEGLSHLNHALETGCYIVKLPEEAALLTFAWLLQHDHHIAAMELLTQIMPFFNRLRFFPGFIDRAPPKSATVHRITTGELIQIIERMTLELTSDMHNTIFTWHPLRDKLVELWLSTVKDGWPCALFSADWTEQCEAWLAEYDKAVVEKRNQLKTSVKKYYSEEYKHSTGGYRRKPGRSSNFSILCDALRRCKIDSSDITGREVGIIRKALNDTVARWGAPGSARLLDLRSQQRTQGLIPTRADIRMAMIERLSKLRSDIGIEDLENAARPVVVGKGKHEMEIPECILRKLNRAAEAPIDRLRELGLIPSVEVRAILVRQQKSRAAATRVKLADLQTLHKQTYRAFSSRRSLPLPSSEHQVTLEELPWVVALSTLRSTDRSWERRYMPW